MYFMSINPFNSDLDKLNYISKESNNLSKEEKAEIDAFIISSMKDLQANYERVHSFLKKEEASVKSLEERAKQLGDLNEKYLSRSSEDPPPVEATSPLKSVQQGLDQAVKVVTTEKERSMKEKIADTAEQITCIPQKKRVKNSLKS